MWEVRRYISQRCAAGDRFAKTIEIREISITGRTRLLSFVRRLKRQKHRGMKK